MPESFDAAEPGAMTKTNPDARRRVLVTGAAGRIGSYFAEHAPKTYALRLMVRGDEGDIDAIRPFGEVVTGDLADLDALKTHCDGMDTIVHLAGEPSPSALWRDLLETNIVGTYHLFAAAKTQKCRRVVYASSIHAVSGYPADVQVKTSEPVNPGDLYGVSKCFGEALGRYMANQEGVSTVAIRIGAFQPRDAAQKDDSVPMLDAFVSHRDLHQLICRAIDAENVQFAVLHGLSDNRFKRLDISDARALLGYAPVDDFTELNPKTQPLHLRETLSTNSGIQDGAESGLRDDV